MLQHALHKIIKLVLLITELFVVHQIHKHVILVQYQIYVLHKMELVAIIFHLDGILLLIRFKLLLITK
jgi:hypothetical protein